MSSSPTRSLWERPVRWHAAGMRSSKGSVWRTCGLAASLFIATSLDLAAAGLQWPPPGKVDRLAQDLTIRNFYVVLDGSGSMSEPACKGGGRKMEQAKSALEVFSKAVPRNANLGLLVFDGRGVAERVPLATDNRQAFVKEVFAVNPSAGTPLRSALTLARQRLEDQARRQLGYGEYNLVVVTDGVANPGEDPRQVVDNMVTRSPIILHTIGFCISNRHSLNQPGRTVYKAADDRADLERGLQAALAEAPRFTADRFTGTR